MLRGYWNFNLNSILDQTGRFAKPTNTNARLQPGDKGAELRFNASILSKLALGNLGNIKSIIFGLQLKTLTEKIFEGDPNAHLIHVANGTITYPDWDDVFVDTVNTNNIVAGVYRHIAVISSTNVACTAAILALNNTTYGNFGIVYCEVFDHQLTGDDLNDDYNDVFGNLKASRTTSPKSFSFSAPSSISEAGFVGCWNGTRTSDGKLADLSGADNHMDIVGALDTQGAYKKGRALQFNGSSDHCKKTVANFRSGDSQGTIEAVIRMSSLASNHVILGSSDEGGTVYYFTFGTFSTGVLFIIALQAGSTLSQISGNTVLEGNKNYHVVVTSNGSKYKMYVNGEDEGVLNVDAGSNGGQWFDTVSLRDNVTIGGLVRTSPVSFADGLILPVNIYSDTKDLAWVQSRWNALASLPAFNMNLQYAPADGITQVPDGVELESGDTKIDEDADGKYIEAVADSIISVKGVDLNYLENNGQRKGLVRDISFLTFLNNKIYLGINNTDKFFKLSIINGQRTFDTATPVIDSSEPFTSMWITTNAGSANNTIVLPLVNSGNINFLVDWGDGTTDIITAWNDTAKTHVYAATGTYTVKIYGTIKGFQFIGGGDRLKLLEISEWGVLDISTDKTFFGCQNLTVSATDAPLISSASFERLFYNVNKTVQMGDIALWGQRMGAVPVTNMVSAFAFCTLFNQDLSLLNVSAVTGMTSMFAGSNSLSTANYSAMLIAWEGKPHQNNVVAHFGNAKYNAGAAAAHQALLDDGWTITDGGAE